MIEAIKGIGAICSAVIAAASCITLIIKPIRIRFINWIRKSTNSQETGDKIAELSSSVCEFIKESKNQKEEMDERINRQTEALLCGLRNTITHIYYKYLPSKSLPIYERENLTHLHDAYHALNGNSYIDNIYNDMMDWNVD